MSIERDKFLIEMLGMCYHETTFREYDLEIEGITGTFIEKICSCGHRSSRGKKYTEEDTVPICFNIDFSRWDNFGKLWEFASKQEWWADMHSCFNRMGFIGYVHESMIHPRKFADIVYEYHRR
jgi:hypothetical protein